MDRRIKMNRRYKVARKKGELDLDYYERVAIRDENIEKNKEEAKKYIDGDKELMIKLGV